MWIWCQSIVGLSEETGGAFHIFNPKEYPSGRYWMPGGDSNGRTPGVREGTGDTQELRRIHLMCRRCAKLVLGELAASHMIMDCRRTREALAKIGFYWPKRTGDIKDMFYGKQR